MVSRLAFVGTSAVALLAFTGVGVGIGAAVSEPSHPRATCTHKPAVNSAEGAQKITIVCTLPKPKGDKITVTRTVTATKTVRATKTVTQTKTVTPPATDPPAGTSTASTTTPTRTATGTPTRTSDPSTVAPPASKTCTDAKAYVDYDGDRYVWDDWSSGGLGDYYADADWWAAGGYKYAQHMAVCSHNSWYTVVTTNDAKGDGAVKAYPNVHKDFHNWSNGHEPKITDYSKISVAYASIVNNGAAGFGAYDVAFDLWANDFDTEIMIWTNYKNQTPAGKNRGSVSIDGHTWNLWATNDNDYIAFVPASGAALDSGTLNVKAFFDYLRDHGRLGAGATLAQIDYGVEMVSTNDRPERFDFTRFDVSAS